MVFLSIIYGFGYIAFATIGFESNPNKKYYMKLLQIKIAIRDFLFCLLIGLWGFYRIKSGIYNETYYFAPLIFIPLLIFFNYLIRLVLKRDLIIATRWDNRPETYKWYYDGLISLILILMPVISCGYMMNYLRFGKVFV